MYVVRMRAAIEEEYFTHRGLDAGFLLHGRVRSDGDYENADTNAQADTCGEFGHSFRAARVETTHTSFRAHTT